MEDLEKKYEERKRWFHDRIGRRVFRNRGTCQCTICQSVEENGLVIADETHASYLNDVEGCSSLDGPEHEVKYFDTKAEAELFEASKK